MDRALLFALMRQESRFDPTARSGAGARGLMQLMPSTASYVAGKLTTDIGRKPDLYEPETNMTLGQHYVRYLMDQKGIENDLILTIAAYNAGPGNIESGASGCPGSRTLSCSLKACRSGKPATSPSKC